MAALASTAVALYEITGALQLEAPGSLTVGLCGGVAKWSRMGVTGASGAGVP